jgi:hypothetical protein
VDRRPLIGPAPGEANRPQTLRPPRIGAWTNFNVFMSAEAAQANEICRYRGLSRIEIRACKSSSSNRQITVKLLLYQFAKQRRSAQHYLRRERQLLTMWVETPPQRVSTVSGQQVNRWSVILRPTGLIRQKGP